MSAPGFAGSYAAADVRFLLEPIELEPLPIDRREQAIAEGRHYSEMIGTEDAPDAERLRIFRLAMEANAWPLAAALRVVGARLAASAVDGEVVIASVARAGTPIGVVLARWLRLRFPALRVAHYSVSVIRDRGVDAAALAAIVERHAPESVRFVDGWTGKGTIARELQASIRGLRIGGVSPGLWVPVDVCGVALEAATADDFLLPHALLGGTVSGLVSRSVLPADEVGSGRLHRCVLLRGLARYDLSRWFVERMVRCMEEHDRNHAAPPFRPWSPMGCAARTAATAATLEVLSSRHGVKDLNRIKLGIGESIRVLLRRQPKAVLLDRSARPPDAELVRRLASWRGVDVLPTDGSPFAAAAVIADPRP